MPLPTFGAPLACRILSRTQAAARLGLTSFEVDKLVGAGILRVPVTTDDVDRLVGRDRLQVSAGELTVLRAGARAEPDPAKYTMDDRQWVGFHVRHTDDELADSSLRWWHCDHERVVDNELLAVTVATFPVAVYRIFGKAATIVRSDETTPRHSFTGQLLGRLNAGMGTTFPQNVPGELKLLARQIMGSTVVVESGGPIGYLQTGPHERTDATVGAASSQR